jgi:hypothetical protein
MSTSSAVIDSRAPEQARQRSLGLRGALGVSVLIALTLAALALWPTRPWAPPHRPGLSAPIVFDELINPIMPAAAEPAAPDTVAH